MCFGDEILSSLELFQKKKANKQTNKQKKQQHNKTKKNNKNKNGILG